MLTVKRIGQVETDNNDRPVDDVKIVKSGIVDWFKFHRHFFVNKFAHGETADKVFPRYSFQSVNLIRTIEVVWKIPRSFS